MDWRAGILTLSAMTMACQALAGSLGDPPVPGSTYLWTAHNSDEDTEFTELVVATGDDFVIYRNRDISGNDLNDPNTYYAVLSGLVFISCGDDMPSAISRERLKRFWPIQTGTQISLLAGEQVFRVTVGDETTFPLMGEDLPGHYTEVEYGEIGWGMSGTDKYVVLEDGRLMAEIRYELGDDEQVERIVGYSPDAGVDPAIPSSDALGSCASLLN